MPQGPASWALLAAVLLFVVFIVVKSRIPLVGRSSDPGEARRQLGAAKQRIRQARNDPQARAQALREAATVALEDLGRPSLAASYARRAERADPHDVAAVRMLSLALRKASRYRALEKLLWRRLAEAESDSAVYERALDELVALYEGPMRRPAQAKALRRLRQRA